MYYKLPAADLTSLTPRLHALAASVGSTTGVHPKLQTRVDTPGGIATVMEIYEGVADPALFGRQLDAALAASGLPAALVDGRRAERFRTL